MNIIYTRFVPATDTTPAYITAWTEEKYITVAADDTDVNHAKVANTLIDKLKLNLENNVRCKLVNGDWVHILPARRRTDNLSTNKNLELLAAQAHAAIAYVGSANYTDRIVHAHKMIDMFMENLEG